MADGVRYISSYLYPTASVAIETADMNFQTQSLKLPVVNFDIIVEEEKKTKIHGELLPDSIRAVFCGPSNCGKTNSLLTHNTS